MISVMSWWCLRIHAGYRCRHAGVCCQADWEIPAEVHVVAAVEHSALRDSAGGRAFMAGLDVDGHVPRRADRTCLFYEPAIGGSCAVHREAGEAALPSACRHFPREFLIDGRGTLVSLSHYCPTAAERLSLTDALDIVDGSSLRIGGPIEGLDATDALPPLLRPGVLTDLDGYAAWERACLDLLARDDLTAREALEAIAALTERVRTWQPGTTPLAPFVRGQTPLRRCAATGGEPGSNRDQATRFAALLAQHVADEWRPVADYEARWQALVEGAPEVEQIAKNYLGARLFANWIAFQGRGLRTIVEWLHACHAVLRNELALRCMADGRRATAADAIAAAGRADLLLVHTIDSQAFATFFADAET